MVHSCVEVQRAPEAPVTWVKDLDPGAEPGDTFGFDSHIGSFLNSFTVSFPEKFCLAGEDVVVPVCGHLAGGCLHRVSFSIFR